MLGTLLSAAGSIAGLSNPVVGAILGAAGPIVGSMLGGSGSPASQSSGPAYRLPQGAVQLLIDALKHPIANISYGGINKPLYDMVKINLLKTLLGVPAGSYTGAEAGWLYPAMMGAYMGWKASGYTPEAKSKSLLANRDIWKTSVAPSEGTAIGLMMD